MNKFLTNYKRDWLTYTLIHSFIKLIDWFVCVLIQTNMTIEGCWAPEIIAIYTEEENQSIDVCNCWKYRSTVSEWSTKRTNENGFGCRSIECGWSKTKTNETCSSQKFNLKQDQWNLVWAEFVTHHRCLNNKFILLKVFVKWNKPYRNVSREK